MSTRAETFRELAELEEKRDYLQRALKDTHSNYFQQFNVLIQVRTKDFDRKSPQNIEIVPDKEVFIDFLCSEIADISIKIERKMDSLKK